MARTHLVLVTALAAVPAHADRDLCAAQAKHHGATVDVDFAKADVRDVLRLLTDVGRVNLVVGDKVDGTVTIRLKGVPWDAAICTIAAVHHLTVTVRDNILLVMKP